MSDSESALRAPQDLHASAQQFGVLGDFYWQEFDHAWRAMLGLLLVAAAACAAALTLADVLEKPLRLLS